MKSGRSRLHAVSSLARSIAQQQQHRSIRRPSSAGAAAAAASAARGQVINVLGSRGAGDTAVAPRCPGLEQAREAHGLVGERCSTALSWRNNRATDARGHRARRWSARAVRARCA